LTNPQRNLVTVGLAVKRRYYCSCRKGRKGRFKGERKGILNVAKQKEDSICKYKER